MQDNQSMNQEPEQLGADDLAERAARFAEEGRKLLESSAGTLDDRDALRAMIETGADLARQFAESCADSISAAVEAGKELADALRARQAYIARIEPYIKAELERMHSEHPETEGVTLEDMFYSLEVANVDEEELTQLEKDFANETDPSLKYVRPMAEAIRRALASYEADKLPEPPEKKKAIIAQPHTRRPESYVKPLDLLTRKAFDGLLDGEKGDDLIPVDISGKNGKPLNVYALLRYDGAEIRGRFDTLDEIIYNSVISLMESGNTCFTAAMVHNVTSTKTNKKTQASEQRLREIADRLDSMLATLAIVDIGDYTTKKGIECKNSKIKQALLPLKAVETTINGTLVSAYKALVPVDEFPLYVYTLASKQKTEIPISCITDIPLRMTEQTEILRELLLGRVAKKECNYPNERVILFSTLFQKIEDELQKTLTRSDKSRIKERTGTILSHWAKNGLIKCWTFRGDSLTTADAVIFCKTKEQAKEYTEYKGKWLA